MSGHATPEELKKVARLEALLDRATSPLRDLIELAQLYLEPCHREADAISLLEQVLARDPNHAGGKFWLAYCYVRFRMDEASVRRAVRLLETIDENVPPYAGAARMLLAEALEDVGALTLEKDIQLLEESVALEPAWPRNRRHLALAYERVGRLGEAESQIREALARIGELDERLSSAQHHFEEAITGRASTYLRKSLHEDLERLIAEANPAE